MLSGRNIRWCESLVLEGDDLHFHQQHLFGKKEKKTENKNICLLMFSRQNEEHHIHMLKR